MNAVRAPVPTFHVPCKPSLFRRKSFRPNNASFTPSYRSQKLPTVCLKMTYRRPAAVCVFGGRGNSENVNKASAWKSIGNAMDNFIKNKSIEDVLKEQVQKQEYHNGGGSGGKNSGRGGGWGGQGEGGADGEGSRERMDEFLQVFAATIGITFLFIFIIQGEEIMVLTKDLIKFLLTWHMSIRLRRLINHWKSFLAEDWDPHWFERAVFSMSTCYDGPRKYQWLKKFRPELLQDFALLPEDDEREASEQEG